jgi:hypothetical protein
VLLLYTFQACDTTADRSWERFDISGRSSNERTKLSLDHLDEFWVLCEDRGGSGAVKLLYYTVSEWKKEPVRGKSDPHTLLDCTYAWLLSVRRNGSIVGGCILRSTAVFYG